MTLRFEPWAWAALLALLTAACSPPLRPDPGPGAPPAPVRAEPRRAGDAWPAVLPMGVHRYEVTVEGTAEARGGPAPAQGVARLRSTAWLTLTASGAPDSVRLQVHADSFSLQGFEPRIAAPQTAVPEGAPYEVLVRANGRTERLTTAGLGCPGRSPLEGAMREVIIPLPAELRIGSQWIDTVVTFSCREGLPITTVSEHRYEAAGAEVRQGMRLLRVRRASTTRLDGSAVRRGRAVGLSGTGTEDATLLVDPARGLLISGDQTVEVTLLLTGGDGEIPIRQRFRQRVRLVD